MTFSSEIKKELSELNNLAKKQEVKYELYGYLQSSNCNKETNKIKYNTESEYNINRFAKILRNVNINDFTIEIQGKIYDITFKKKDIDSLELDEIKLKEINDSELLRAAIRGMFMGSGSINNPENTYHLEIELANEQLADSLVEVMQEYGVKLKKLEKSVYIKDGEGISNILAFIGATKSVLKFEEIRVQKHMNNKVNRLVNCKTANLDKVMTASAEQIAAIEKLKKNGKFQKLDESLKEIAELRLEHPDMPLSELGNKLKKPVGKSGVKKKKKKIVELSKE